MWRPSHTLKVAAHTHAQTEREQARVVQRRGGMCTRPAGVLPARLSQPYGQPMPAMAQPGARWPHPGPVVPAWPSPSRTRTGPSRTRPGRRSEKHTSELQSHVNLVCRLLLEKKKKHQKEAKRFKNNKQAKIRLQK